MSDLTLGVDVSDVIARLALIPTDGRGVARADELVSGIVASNRAPAIKDAVKKAVAGIGGKVGAIRGPVRVRVQLASVKRQGVGGKQMRVEAGQQLGEPALVGRGDDEHTRALRRRELAIVEVIAIERDQRAPQLPRQPVVLGVARAAQVGMIHHAQHVPSQLLAHVGDDTRGHVRIGIHARPVSHSIGDWAQLTPQGSHMISDLGSRISDLLP